jgi:hypothetical protein
MNHKAYERECERRRPAFRLDLMRLLDEHPKILAMYVWRWSGGKTPPPPAMGPDDPELKALREFQKKYPMFDSTDEIHFVVTPYPFVFDPAWKIAVDQALARVDSGKGGGGPPGLVTRAGMEPEGSRDTPETREVYAAANRLFEDMHEEMIKRFWRQLYSGAIFRSARLFLPIGPETSLEQIQRLWPSLRQAQRACYGEPRRRRAVRRGIYEQRLMVWDLVREDGLSLKKGRMSLKEPIRRSGLTGRTFWRRYYEARRDIAGEVREKIGAEAFATHVAGCGQCQGAARTGLSDRVCDWMQKQLGRRSPRDKGLRVSESVVNAASMVAWRQQENQARHQP